MAWIHRPDVRALLWWCLPALIVGLTLRGALWVKMPHAFYHPDSDQVFDTWRSLLHGSLHFHEKKTPLGPLLYCLPPLLRLPVLPAIALVQHLLGLGIVLMIGTLVAGSFTRWHLFIVPVTLLVAANPILLWYEHVALPETFYVFSIVATALTGLLYCRKPDTPRLIALGAALYLTAGFRPEGKLFCLFGIALAVCATWGEWKKMRNSAGSLLILTALCIHFDRTAQSGSLLYSNVAHLTPEKLWSPAGFTEAHPDYFSHLPEKWPVTPAGRIARERKQLIRFLRDYLAARNGGKEVSDKAVERLCGRIGAEVCLRNAHRLPALSLAKFRCALGNRAAEDFGPDWLYRKQTESLAGDFDEADRLATRAESSREFVQIAYGRDFDSRQELENHLRQLYRPFIPDWLSAWQERYSAAILAWRLPDRPLDRGTLSGMPYLYIAATAGLLAMAVRDRRLRTYHFLWLGMLLFMAFVLTLTGSNLGRFRVGFESFWFLYAFGLLDVVLGLLVPKRRRNPVAQV